MRIAFVLSQSLESPSGLGRFGPLAREVAKLGHEVELLALHHDFHSLSRPVFYDRGVLVKYVAQMHVLKRGSHKSYFGRRQLLAVSMLSTARLAVALARSKADIVQLCKPQPINALACHLGALGRPIYCDCDDYEAETNRFSANWQRSLVRRFEDGVTRYAAGLTVNTRFTFERYVELGFPPERIVYVPNGVERTRFELNRDLTLLRRRLGINAGDRVVVYVGTISTFSHAVGLLLSAFARVVSRMPAARLLLVGGGEDFDLLRSEPARLGIADRVTFVGRVDPDTVADYYRLGTLTVDPVADDLIARARSPLKIVESLTCGVPVVTGEIGDRRRMLGDGDSGVLVAPGDAAALADGMLCLLEDPQLCARAASAAQATRESWYWDTLANDFASVYAPARPARTA